MIFRKIILCALIGVIFPVSVYPGEKAGKGACSIDGAPINWIARYCGFIAETDDEIVIQESPCFKAAASDLKEKSECGISTKYKRKLCELVVKEKRTDHKTVSSCLGDQGIKPFVAGEQ